MKHHSAPFIMLFALLLCLGACQGEDPGTVQGYVEGQFTFAAAPVGGRLLRLAVGRGQWVEPGQELFGLDPQPEADAAAEAESALAQARANLANLQKGARPTEIQGLEAQLARAESNFRLSALEFERRKKLYSQKAIPKSEYDRYRTAYLADQAVVDNARAQLATARLGARADEISAAADAEAMATSRLAQARWQLAQKNQAAQARALVFDTLYTVGEYVGPSAPVVQLLAPGDVRVRFFVSETVVGALSMGQKVSFGCDGCPAGFTAEITYISPQAEYTPPVIYSVKTRQKLVFMIEATPDAATAAKLHPGQPVDVALPPEAVAHAR